MATREEILSAAQRHLISEPTASLGDLASAAGIGRATLHRHFASRDELLVEIAERSLDRWQERLDHVDVEAVAASGDGERIRACLIELMHAYVLDAEEFGVALTDHVATHTRALRERCDALLDREVLLHAAGQETGVLRRDVPARWIGHAVYGLLVAARDALEAGDVARRDLPDLVLTTLVDGVSA
ncbi:TetR/AcrR family transcriptional regulator [Nocardioides sp. R-C-SC26]|uniref:TetR/AcrR family transcriptional regulator n=1 Tax=Nocardioides sp. R-C-SC26 TaxID=2870414 RepID=UPI001E473165|nr:TetR/AcrR family transcriptional regulator [Nocardioides sp. R-C-SC26]